MIEPPRVEAPAQLVAAIHIETPRSRIQHVMGAGIGEAMAAVKAHGIGPAGPRRITLPQRNGNLVYRRLWARLEHQIEWGLGSAPESAEAAAGHHYLTQSTLAGLRTKRGTVAGKRYRHADLRRCSVHHSTHRIQIVLNVVVREGLDDHHRPVLIQRAPRVARHADGVAHIVKAIKKCDEIERIVAVAHRIRHFKLHVRHA